MSVENAEALAETVIASEIDAAAEQATDAAERAEAAADELEEHNEDLIWRAETNAKIERLTATIAELESMTRSLPDWTQIQAAIMVEVDNRLATAIEQVKALTVPASIPDPSPPNSDADPADLQAAAEEASEEAAQAAEAIAEVVEPTGKAARRWIR